MTYDQALDALRAGHCVARQHWVHMRLSPGYLTLRWHPQCDRDATDWVVRDLEETTTHA